MNLNKRSKANQRGITFIEVVLSMFMVVIMLGPLVAVWSTANNSRAQATRVADATRYANTLMQEVKKQMNLDIIEMQKRQGNKLELGTLTSNQEERYRNIVTHYLKDRPDNEILALTEFLMMSNIEDLNAYHTEQFAYEVMLWNIESAPIDAVTHELTVNTSALDKAYKLYTEPEYQFTSNDYQLEQAPITFKMNENMLKAFTDRNERYLVATSDELKEYDVVDTIKIVMIPDTGDTIKIKQESQRINNIVKVDETKVQEVKNRAGEVVGYNIYIEETGVRYTSTPTGNNTLKPIVIVEIDMSKLLRHSDDLSKLINQRGKVFKVINLTQFDTIVRIYRSGIETDTLFDVDDAFQFTTEKIADTTSSGVAYGKINFQRIDEKRPYSNYLLAIIVRDKNPLPGTGEKGKIIKKVWDIFSYDPSLAERWG